MQGPVDVLHDPVKHACVDVFGERVAGVGRLFAGHILHVRFRSGDQLPVTEPVLHLLQLHAQQPAEVSQVEVVVGDVTGLSVSLGADLDVSQVKDGGDNFKNAALAAVLDP